MAFVLLGVLTLAACGDDNDNSAATETTQAATETTDLGVALLPDRDALSFGALWETPPVIGVDPADTSAPVGAAPDLTAAMAPLLGVDVEWQNLQWPAQLPGVQSGTVDVLFGQVTITEERELSIVDLIPFYKTTFSLLLPPDNPEGLTRLADACGLSIGVPVGSVNGELVAAINESVCVPDGKDPIEAAEYQGASAAISALQAGTIDGWLNSITENQLAADSTGLANVKLPEDEYAGTYTGLAVSKDQPEVSVALAAALKELIENGTYGEIMANWGLENTEISADEVVINPITGTEPGVVAAGN